MSTDKESRNAAVSFFSPQNTAFYASRVYTTLDFNRKEIRLLKLLPGSGDDQPQCFICAPRPLRDISGRYEALSYCAGSPRETECVKVNGHDFNVFTNLDRGLRRLRRHKKTRILWIDLICINQDDIAERSFQVQLMGEIYANARRGVVWLGPLVDEKLALEQIEFLERRLQEELTSRKKLLIRDSNDRELQMAYQNIGAPGLRYKDSSYVRLELWSALVSLVAAPAWTRCWIAQEIVMVPEAKVYGATIAFDLDRCWPVYDATVSYISLKTDIENNPSMAHAENREELLQLQRKCVPSQLGRFCAARRKRLVSRRRIGNEAQDPTHVIRTARLASSTDPRDRVYAFLGLMKPDFGIVPNYAGSNHVEDVYFDACCAFIMKGKSLNFLAEGQELKRDPSSHLPSWVPDWTIEQGRVALADRHFMKEKVPYGVSELQANATGHRLCAGDEVVEDVWEAADVKIHSGPNGRVLHTNVLIIDTVEYVLQPENDWGSWMSARGSAQEACEAHRAKNISGGILPKRNEKRSGSDSGLEDEGNEADDSTSEVEDEIEETVEDWESQWKSHCELEADRDLALWWKNDIDAINNAHFGDGYDVYAIDNAIYCTSMLSDDAYGAEDEWERAQLKDDFFQGHRRFFISQSNTMGMGPPRLQQGDIVCIFLGCACPLIVRKKNNRHYLVGEAFVKGYCLHVWQSHF